MKKLKEIKCKYEIIGTNLKVGKLKKEYIMNARKQKK